MPQIILHLDEKHNLIVRRQAIRLEISKQDAILKIIEEFDLKEDRELKK